jgi:energy-converting hydrogenase Eha subunit G
MIVQRLSLCGLEQQLLLHCAHQLEAVVIMLGSFAGGAIAHRGYAYRILRGLSTRAEQEDYTVWDGISRGRISPLS